MTTFITFTETRKKQIDHLRARVMEERPVRHVSTFRGTDYVTITRPLSLIDYAVYAALRGADYRKGDHTGGKVATQELKGLIARFKAYGTGSTNLLPSGSTVEEIAEFIEALETELAKWKDAPVVTAADISAFGPAVDRAIDSFKARRTDLAAFGATQADKGEAK